MIGRSGSGGRTAKRLSTARQRACSAEGRIGCHSPVPVISGFMNRFSRTVMVGARLSSARLLETKPTRLAMASRGRGASSGAPPSATRPAVRATSPNSTRPTVSWPAPRSPTSPTISPAATVKETGPTSPATSPSTASMVPAVPAGGLTNSSDSERPTM